MITKTIKIRNKEYQVNCYEENGKTVVELPDELKELDGYGTALKPAYEPIVLCRKPLEKGGYVNSVLEYGTSGLNIDGGRIEGNVPQVTQGVNSNGSGYKIAQNLQPSNPNNLGRFPANFGLICTCESEPCECVDSELDRQSGVSKDGVAVKRNHKDNTNKPSTVYGVFW